MLAKEAAVIEALIGFGSLRDENAAKRFRKFTTSAARFFYVDPKILQDHMLRAAAKNLSDGGALEDENLLASGSPDARIGGHEDGDDGCSDGGREMTDAGVVPDVQACC